VNDQAVTVNDGDLRRSLDSVARLGSPPPRQLTSSLDFDATSRIAWFQG